jgi:putative ABC transport system permease protein
MLLSIAVRNLTRQRTRALLTLASVGFGVASLMLAAGFIDDILAQLRDATIHSQLGHFEVFAPGYVDAGRREPLAHTLADSRTAIAALRAIPGVTTIAPRLSFSGLLSNGRTDATVSVEGIDPVAEHAIGTAMTTIAGNPLGAVSGPAVVVVDGLAHTLNLRVGDSVTVLASTRDGALNTLDAPVAGVFRSPFRDYDERAVRISLRDAQDLVATDSVNSLAVLLRSDASVDEAVAAARQALPAARYDIRPWWSLADFYEATASLYRRQFVVLLTIVAVMVLLGVANSVNMSLHERQAEFGTVRALGYGAGAVFRQIIVESALLGVAAALAGIVLGLLLAWGISAIGIDMPPPPNSDVGYRAAIRVSFPNVALAAAIGILAAVIGAVLPARRLARMPIVDALRHAI